MDNNKLDEAVKKTLRNYEVPYNDTDWVQMESMLDVAPNHSPLNRSYSPVILFALVILGAAFLLYAVFKPSESPEKTSVIKTDTLVPRPIVKMKSPELKPVTTHSVIADPVLPATRSVAVAPIVTSGKKEVKTTEKKVVEKKLTEKKTAEKKTTVDKTTTLTVVSPSKDSKKTTLISQESKAKLFKKTLEKNKKATKQEPKAEVKQVESDTVHIDDENDSNRNRKALNTNTSESVPDSLKNSQEKKTGTKGTRKSRRDKKTSVNDTLSKNLPSN